MCKTANARQARCRLHARVLQVSHERAELARQLSQQQAAMEEEQHSRKKMRRKLGKRLEEAERQVVHLQQCLEEKYAAQPFSDF